MARPPQPIDPKRQTRLLARARVVFATHGFTNARLTNILRESDFPRSSFYYFFHTKDQLFDAAFADGLRELAGYVTVPDVDKLTRDTFWPALTKIITGMTNAATRPDLTAVGTMFHLADKPRSPTSPNSNTPSTSGRRAWSTGVYGSGCSTPPFPHTSMLTSPTRSPPGSTRGHSTTQTPP